MARQQKPPSDGRSSDGGRPPLPRIPYRAGIGVAAAVVYVVLAAVVPNLLDAWLEPPGSEAEYALGHAPVLLLIAAGIGFVLFSGWGPRVWRTPAAFETQPRRWWMLAIPALVLANAVVVLTAVPWNRRAVGLVALVLVVTALVGLGEELYFRGILRASVRDRHGETFALLLTALLFGAAHAVGSLLAGLDPAFIVFQVGVTAVDGAIYYGVFRATGRLWVAAALHGLTDFVLYLSADDLSDRSGSSSTDLPASVGIEVTLWVLCVVLVVSCVRQDRRERARLRGVTPAS